MQRLNIPIKPNTTRQNTWRVVWMFTLLITSLILSYSIFRLITTIDHTSGIRPVSTTSTVRVLKNAQTTGIIQDKLGSEQLLNGTPWTVNDFLRESNREFSLHFDGSELIAVSIDKKLSEDWQNEAKNFDYQVVNENNRSLVSKIGEDTTFHKAKADRKLLNPLLNGEILIHNTDTSLITPLRLTKSGITVRNQIKTNLQTSNIILPESSTIFARVQIEQNDLDSAFSFTQLTGNTSTQLIRSIKENGAQITLGTDSQGAIYNVTIPQSQLTVEELAELGQEMINSLSLSTTALTIADGTTVEEIVVDRDQIQSSIDSSNDFSFILLKNDNGDTVRIVKTADQVSISNREISSEISQFSINSSCLPSAHSFIQPGEVNALSQEKIIFTPKFEQLFSSLNFFSEVAISNAKAKLCW